MGESIFAADSSERPQWVNRTIAVGWVLLLVSWTFALLVPVPEEAVRTLGGSGSAFTFGKILHVAGYAVLAIGIALQHAPRAIRMWLIAGLVAHTGLGELVQGLVGRHPAIRDVALDLGGVLLGVMLTRRWWRAPVAPPPESDFAATATHPALSRAQVRPG
jgi:VanZ family protein